MNHTPLNGSSHKAGTPQRLPRHLSSSSRRQRSSAWSHVNNVASLLAVGVAVFGLLVGGAVLDREQRLQLQEAAGVKR